MSKPRNYKIVIFQDVYTVLSDESEEHVMQAANLVDLFMQEIAKKSNSTDGKKIAVLAALQIASSLVALESKAQANDSKLQELAHKADQALNSLSSSGKPDEESILENGI